MRRKIICGNWKLHHDVETCVSTIKEIAKKVGDSPAKTVVVAPVATMLFAAKNAAHGSAVKIAAQNVFFEESGAFTGELAVGHLAEIGCEYCIVGHSERRHIFGESDEWVGKKVAACIKGGIIPIACVGEKLEEREDESTKSVIYKQLSKIFEYVSEKDIAKVVFAYEPVWAIGTGKNASAMQAQEVHEFIRGQLADKFGLSRAENVSLLYGGSVRPDNTAEITSQRDIDGVLVGGASLKADSFCEIVRLAI